MPCCWVFFFFFFRFLCSFATSLYKDQEYSVLSFNIIRRIRFTKKSSIGIRSTYFYQDFQDKKNMCNFVAIWEYIEISQWTKKLLCIAKNNSFIIRFTCLKMCLKIFLSFQLIKKQKKTNNYSSISLTHRFSFSGEILIW